MPDKETRIITAEALELRAAGDGEDGPTIAGYGAVFNSPSLDLGGFREIIAPGAFSRSLKSRGRDVMSFFNHDPSMPLGSLKAGNLTVSEDDKGLVYEVKPPATTYANDLVEAMRAKLVRGSSFTFSVKKDTWTEDNGVQVRTLLDVDLFELGPVTNPAYPAANSQVRALLESRGIKLTDLSEQRDGDLDDDDLLELLSGRAFDECFLACLVEAVGDVLELTALAPTRSGDQAVIDLANRESGEAQAEVAMLRDFQARFLAGESLAPPAPEEENSLKLPTRLALLRRRLELLKPAH